MTVYDDNTLLTCMALSDEFAKNSKVDLKKWDAKVPDLVIEPRKERKAVMIETGRTMLANQKQDDGSYLAYDTGKPEKIQLQEWSPVYDEKGKGLEAFLEPVFEIVEVPEQKIQRKHATAHTFARMIEDGFDPRDPKQYIKKLRADRALPGMPTEADWKHGELSMGEIHNRLWLATELLALVVINHEERIAQIERRL